MMEIAVRQRLEGTKNWGKAGLEKDLALQFLTQVLRIFFNLRAGNFIGVGVGSGGWGKRPKVGEQQMERLPLYSMQCSSCKKIIGSYIPSSPSCINALWQFKAFLSKY